MSHRTYFYCRVSTTEQTTSNQIEAFKRAGYTIRDDFVVEEIVSGAVCAMERKGFRALVEHKLMRGDSLIVLKLDRLGRDNIDIQKTIELLTNKGISIKSLDITTEDLTSSEGKLMLRIFSAFAEFERDRIRERTIEGQKRARAEGKRIGRPNKVSMEKVLELRSSGFSISQTASKLEVSIATVKRLSNQSKPQKNT